MSSSFLVKGFCGNHLIGDILRIICQYFGYYTKWSDKYRTNTELGSSHGITLNQGNTICNGKGSVRGSTPFIRNGLSIVKCIIFNKDKTNNAIFCGICSGLNGIECFNSFQKTRKSNLFLGYIGTGKYVDIYGISGFTALKRNKHVIGYSFLYEKEQNIQIIFDDTNKHAIFVSIHVDGYLIGHPRTYTFKLMQKYKDRAWYPVISLRKGYAKIILN